MDAIRSAWVALGVVTAVACTGVHEQAVRRDLAAHSARRAKLSRSAGPPAGASAERQGKEALPPADGLAAYVALALDQNPEVRAAFERWRASVLRISRTRSLPDPTLSFSYFVRSVYTAAGPQRARLSLQQAFPWPTELTAGADAASARAKAAQRTFEARALSVAQRVAEAYWNLWQIRQTRRIHREHLLVLRGLSETVRARIATGSASLADQQQVDLTAARTEDVVRGLEQAEVAARARLRAALSAAPGTALPTPEPPADALLPAESEEALIGYALAHPSIESLGYMAEAEAFTAEAKHAERLPSFTVGADWIITDDSPAPDMLNAGQDAVMVAAGIRVPLWQGSYADSVAAARAESQAQRAEQEAAGDRATAELMGALSDVRDAVRRVALYMNALLPQAQSAYASVLGAYTTGRSTVAQTLLSQEDLLELRVELEKARADYARAWARLEQVTGRQIARGRPALDEEAGSD